MRAIMSSPIFLTVACATQHHADRSLSSPDVDDKLTVADASLFARRLCGLATGSITPNKTSEFRECMSNVAMKFSSGEANDQITMTIYICDELVVGEKWQQQAYGRVGCYRNAVGLIKSEKLIAGTRECGNGISDSPAVNRQWSECYAREFRIRVNPAKPQ